MNECSYHLMMSLLILFIVACVNFLGVDRLDKELTIAHMQGVIITRLC